MVEMKHGKDPVDQLHNWNNKKNYLMGNSPYLAAISINKCKAILWEENKYHNLTTGITWAGAHSFVNGILALVFWNNLNAKTMTIHEILFAKKVVSNSILTIMPMMLHLKKDNL